MPKPKIDKIKLSQLLRSGKSQRQVAQVFGVTEGAISKAKKELDIAVVKNVALENAHRVVDKNLNAIEQLQKINDYANEILDLLMRWNRGDDEALQILETQVKKVRVTENYEALDLYYEADKLFMRYEKESNSKARELLTKAIELDPKFSRAIAFLGWTHYHDFLHKWVKNPAQSFKKAEECANRAIAINETEFLGHQLLSGIYTLKRLYEQAIAAAERSVEAEPNNATAILGLAWAMLYSGKYEEGLVLMKKVMRLAPHPPLYFLSGAVIANYLTGRYEAAITPCKKFLKQQQQGPVARILWQFLIASYMELGREEEARAEVKKLLEQHPDFSIETYIEAMKRRPYKDLSFLDHQIELLRKAGLK